MADIRIAVIDDWQEVARTSADWSRLSARADIAFLSRSFPPGAEREATEALRDYDIILPMRERSQFSATLLQHLPRLKMLSLTGLKAPHVDLAACTRQGIVVSQSGSKTHGYAAEMTLGLMLAAMRHIAAGDAAIRAGRFQEGLPLGGLLRGKTLGIIGLGRIGAEVAGFGQALGMRILAWSQNLTAERAEEVGATRVDKEALLRQADVVSLHLVLSERSRNTLGRSELACMKPDALLVNTSRGPLVDEAALLEALAQRRIRAALDVYDQEPLPADHPLRHMPNTVLTPHLGFATREIFGEFYDAAIEAILAFLDGAPLRVANPEAVIPTRAAPPAG